MTLLILMKYKKSTINTFVYEEIDNNGSEAVSKIPSLYIRKSAFNGNAPERICVTVEVDHG